ncbi:glutaredoxin domain-containing protein [Actinomyces succiniciruminis]|uniref:Glutaredoxin n=1 Tax=Actinomyces succiniciruminis TaxID=1522002 RepID=A0A1L7RBN7_9ACTO|nr:glutaredoxin domain-containing protein [Actinomyces succiniciruminis]CED91305.1 Glutaredoxin [Actinomyces succiniciruminis]
MSENPWITDEDELQDAEETAWAALSPYVRRVEHLVGFDDMDIEDPTFGEDGAVSLLIHPSWTGPTAEQSVHLTMSSDDVLSVQAGGTLTAQAMAGQLDPASLDSRQLAGLTPELASDAPLGISSVEAGALILGVDATTMQQAIDSLRPGMAAARAAYAQASQAADAPITIYTTPHCMGCEMTRRQLDKAGVDYQVIDLTTRPDLVAQFRGEGLTSAPIVESPDGERTAGFRPDRIKAMVSAATSPTPAAAPTPPTAETAPHASQPATGHRRGAAL